MSFHSSKKLVAGLAILLANAAPASAQLKLGVFGPFTGDAAAYGQSEREGVEIAVKEINAKGGVRGQPVTAVFADDAGKPEQAANVATRLTTRDGVTVLLGSISSPASLAASQIAQQNETPQIVITSTAQRITTGGNPWIFRSTIPDTAFAESLATFLSKKYPQKKRYAVIYVNDDFGKGGIDKFNAKAQSLGLALVADEKYARGDLDFTSQLSRIRSANADVIVEWSRYNEQALISRQRKQMGLDILHVAGDGTPKYLELAGEAAEGVMYPTDFSMATARSAIGQDLVRRVREDYKRDADYVHAQAYDAVLAVAKAAETAGSTDRTKVRDALRTVKFEGARGLFAFDEKGDPTHSAAIIAVKGGKETDGSQ